MVAIQLRRIGLGQWRGVNGFEQRIAVIFVEAGAALHGLGRDAKPLRNARQRLYMALERADVDSVELHAPLAPVFAQTQGLCLAALAELVVICGSKRGLAMAHEV